jgi:hypothetical protein
MLTRPPAVRKRKRETTRERRRLAQREYRRRLDAGRITVAVEIDAAVVEMLVASRWLPDGDSADRKQIGKALSAMVAEAAKR